MAMGLTPTAKTNKHARCMRMNGRVRTQSMRSAVGCSVSKLDARPVSNQCSTAAPKRTRGLLEVCVSLFMDRKYGRTRVKGCVAGNAPAGILVVPAGGCLEVLGS